MKLNVVQWLWVSAAVLFVLALLLDVANVWNVPPIYMLLGASLLVVTEWTVMPSLKELGNTRRRR
ncbi:hypothetical protein SH584_04230 [Sphingomonas sp. LY29]|uniref:hypothetical protein n=1 Tax=Sphingomonas sp. LY29 TaxID=3095341 RepID=UPI002D7A18ED|nr:hypothetical protein [Sphingomonas sp. LY29]WRP26649.1 hypothetical protein SH584_04230 [Sphingomonas sp. LY29]